MKKVSNKVYIFQKVLDYLGVALLGIVLLFIWQLYRGPIEVPFLKPYIIQALNNDTAEAEVNVDNVTIELVRSLQPIKIVAKDVTFKRHDESIKIRAPRTEVSFSLKALMHGVIAPSSIAILSPEVYIFSNYGINENSKKEVRKKQLSYYFKAIEDFLERFNSDDHSYVESYINNIKISNGELELHEVELGRKWNFSDFNYQFDRNLLNIATDANALINLDNGTTASIGIEGKYRSMQQKLGLDFYFSDVVPNNVIGIFLNPQLAQEIYRINLPISGRITTVIDIKKLLDTGDDISKLVDTVFNQINFQFEGGAGHIKFDNTPDNNYKISSFLLEGSILGGINQISIKDASFDLGKQKALLSAEISGLKKYFLEQSQQDLKAQFTAQVDEMEVNKLYDYWPKYIATPGWNWCHDSMRDGVIKNAKFVFDFGIDKSTGSFSFLNLDGQGDVDGVSIDYLTGMPKIINLVGTAKFTNHNIRIDASSGESEGIKIVGGYVDLYDLDKKDNFADISIDMKSSIRDALKMIDNKPLQYTSEMGLNPDSIEGFASTKLGLKFEMKQNLTPQEVNVNVVSDITDFSMNNVIKDKGIKASSLKLEVTNKGLLASGDATLDDIPISLQWTENFISKDYRSRYNIGFKFDEQLKKKLDLDISVLEAPFVQGDSDMNAEITIYDNERTDIDISSNLQPMDIDFSFLGYRKPKGEKGSLSALVQIKDNKLHSISNLKLSNNDIELSGALGVDNKGRINIVDINEIKGVKTNAKAKIDISYEPKQKVKVNISGNSYNLMPFFERSENKTKIDKSSIDRKAPEEEDSLEKTIDADIFIAVNNLWTNPHIAITNFAGSAKLVNGIGIEEIHMVGNFKNRQNTSIKFDYTPRPNNEFYLSVDSNDAGSTLKVLQLYNDMEGGNLKIEARRNKDKGLVGHAKIRNFNIHNTPLVAKFLSVASFRGMLDLLTGSGISFSHLDAPFEYRHKQLMLKKAKAFGNVVGFTANGTYDKRFDELDIRGQVAPAYSLNMILGSIPLVGNLLAGKDGTVFAADYYISGDIADASIKINPLSALSPNSLKETISSLFGSDDE